MRKRRSRKLLCDLQIENRELASAGGYPRNLFRTDLPFTDGSKFYTPHWRTHIDRSTTRSHTAVLCLRRLKNCRVLSRP